MGHAHAGGDITSGVVAEAFIDSAIARDAEVMPIVLSSDGSGSTLDADLLDGQDASAFLTDKTSPLALRLRTVAMLQWWRPESPRVQNYAVGDGPNAVAFDGANVWVANSFSNNVWKLRASDGAVLGTYAAGDSPTGVAFDGASIWVANYFDNNVTKLRASDGALQGTYAVGPYPYGVAFDGVNIWVADSDSDTVTKL